MAEIGTGTTTTKQKHEPKFIHPAINNIPIEIRFLINGVISNVAFLAGYNVAVSKLEHLYTASQIYSIFYLLYIPFGHLISISLVFGWPDKYLTSLLSNFPIGLTAMAVGTVLTSHLESIEFNASMKQSVLGIKAAIGIAGDEDKIVEEEEGEFFSSLVVLIVTSLWSYYLSVYVNTPSSKSEDKDKKEL